MVRELKFLTLAQIAERSGLKVSDISNLKLHKRFLTNYSPSKRFFIAEESEFMAKKHLLLEAYKEYKEGILERREHHKQERIKNLQKAKQARSVYTEERRRQMSETARAMGLGKTIGIGRGDSVACKDDPNYVLKERLKLLKQIAKYENELGTTKGAPLTPMEKAVLNAAIHNNDDKTN